MAGKIELLDCTLRDGAYIVKADFGISAIKGIINRLQAAGVDIIECGWLKNDPHKTGTSFYHVPSDLEPYLTQKHPDITYVAMIDWDRYDPGVLPECDHRSIDAIRVVFPRGKHRDAIRIGNEIREKGYRLYFQAANTLGYSEEDLKELVREMNQIKPEALSVVDTFGAMFADDLERIIHTLDSNLDPAIKLGFHSHNNQQLSFALSIRFVELLRQSARDMVVDASLCGMGRGAGNTTTELLVSYLNRKQNCRYELDHILDAIDIYMETFKKNYSWGYDTPYFLSGMYCAHVNNIAYLHDNHRTYAKDMRAIFASMTAEDRLKYDYDLLEQKYLDHISSEEIDDTKVLQELRRQIGDRKVLLLCSGKTVLHEEGRIREYIASTRPIVIGINALFPMYTYDYCFFSNKIRYAYAMTLDDTAFQSVPKMVTSNIKTEAGDNEQIINFSSIIKRGWRFFDNAGILCLRFLHKIGVRQAALAGFDGFSHTFSDNYADEKMPSVNADNDWDIVNRDISDMLRDFRETDGSDMSITFVTPTIFSQNCN